MRRSGTVHFQEPALDNRSQNSCQPHPNSYIKYEQSANQSNARCNIGLEWRLTQETPHLVHGLLDQNEMFRVVKNRQLTVWAQIASQSVES